MIFSNDVIDKLRAQAELDQPLFSGNYSNLARIAKAELAFNRPKGSISENPLERYIELRQAMEILHDPVSRYRPLKWRITWHEMIATAIPDDEMELFCSLLFASSLMSVVRHWYSFDAVLSLSPPYWDQWTDEIQGNPLFQGDYAKAQDCDVRFSSQLEGCIRPVWGILSSAYSVISPHSLPTWVLDISFKGKGSQPTYLFFSREYSASFGVGAKYFFEACKAELSQGSVVMREKGSRLLNLWREELHRRYNVVM